MSVMAMLRVMLPHEIRRRDVVHNTSRAPFAPRPASSHLANVPLIPGAPEPREMEI